MKSLLFFKLIFFSLIFITSLSYGFSQNLVPNPGFEEYINCPSWAGEIAECPPWQDGNGNTGSCDYFNVCATGTIVWIPDNNVGYQETHTGNGYAGFCAIYPNTPPFNLPFYEYPQVQLTEP